MRIPKNKQECEKLCELIQQAFDNYCPAGVPTKAFGKALRDAGVDIIDIRQRRGLIDPYTTVTFAVNYDQNYAYIYECE